MFKAGRRHRLSVGVLPRKKVRSDIRDTLVLLCRETGLFRGLGRLDGGLGEEWLLLLLDGNRLLGLLQAVLKNGLGCGERLSLGLRHAQRIIHGVLGHRRTFLFYLIETVRMGIRECGGRLRGVWDLTCAIKAVAAKIEENVNLYIYFIRRF